MKLIFHFITSFFKKKIKIKLKNKRIRIKTYPNYSSFKNSYLIENQFF